MWFYDEVGHTQDAKKELVEIMDFADSESVFITPKPTRLLERILQIATNPGDLVLDSFAGSGTTGHAVLKMNEEMAAKERSEHKEAEEPGNSLRSLRSLAGNAPRRFILVEMEPKIVREVTAERVRRVAEGYTNRKGEPVEGIGGGFRFCELGERMFEDDGKIRDAVRFAGLARHVYFTETGEPLPEMAAKERKGRKEGGESENSFRSPRSFAAKASPFLGVCRGVGIYLLYNGILGDKSAQGGNVLTRATLAQLPPFDGPKVIYCAGCLLGRDRLQAERITPRQTPYEIKTI